MNPTNRCRVLYAEVNEDARFMISVMLEFSEIEVVTAATAAAAWDFACAEQFNLFLLDTQLPDGCGFELCRRLREFAPQTPVIFYSGHAYETDVNRGLAAGAVAYLVKPYFDDLAVTIKRYTCYNGKPAANHENFKVSPQGENYSV